MMAFGEAEAVAVNIIVCGKISKQVYTLNIWVVKYLTEILRV
jgi:hypothetical protein